MAPRGGSGKVGGEAAGHREGGSNASRHSARGTVGPRVPRRLKSEVFFSSRRRHTRFDCDWSSDVCSSDLDCNTKTMLEKAQKAVMDIDTTSQPKHQHIQPILVESYKKIEALTNRGTTVTGVQIGRASCRERV